MQHTPNPIDRDLQWPGLPPHIALRVTSGLTSGVITSPVKTYMVFAAIGTAKWVKLAQEMAETILAPSNKKRRFSK